MDNDIKIRLFCEDSLQDRKEVFLKKEQTHYLRDVMRCKIGAKILLFDGTSGEYLSEISSINRKKTGFTVLRKTRPIEIPGDAWLIFCPLKKQRTDFLVEKCTELGVRRFLPVISQNSQTRRIAAARIKAQVIEAVEQCGGTFIPEIDSLNSFQKVAGNFPINRRIIFCDETLEFDNIQNVLKGSNFERVGIFIGPEGGFSQSERNILKQKTGAVQVSLGQRILRAETAAVSALTTWHSVAGDWIN